jgi:hypothetical protein
VTSPFDSTGTGFDASVPVEVPIEPTGHERRSMDRLRAALEVFLCSGIPTQLFVSGLLLAVNVRPLKDGQLDATWVSLVTLGDTLLVLGLAVLLIRSHGESPREVFFDSRPAMIEAVRHPARRAAAHGGGPRRALAPPLAAGTAQRHREPVRRDAAVAPRDRRLRRGRARRRRGERKCSGRSSSPDSSGTSVAVVGLVVTSLAFGAGHWVQGWDSSIAIGLLGAVWGFIYLRRRSVVAPMVSHAGFNSFEIVQFLIAGSV